MAEPTNREEFKNYLFRRLGFPFNQVNVTNEQAEDRIDDALDFFKDYHYLGSERSFYVHTLTQEEIDNKTIDLPDNIATVTNILPMTFESNSSNFMSDRYQFLRSEFFGLATSVNYSLIPYYVAMMRIADLDYLLSMSPSINYEELLGKVKITGNDPSLLKAGNKIVFDGVFYSDPNTSTKIWGDRWLKKYATALMKRQWAENLKLYSNVPLLGGITIDAASMFQEAVEEISQMEEQMKNATMPVLDDVG